MPTTIYRLEDGRRVPGVTTILSNLGWNREGLMYWAWEQGKEGKEFREAKQAAADIGTIVHQLIEANLRGIVTEAPEPSTAAIALENFLTWRASMQLQVIALEPHLISERYRYGGTPDCIAKILGQTALFDWKTSNKVYPDMWIQLEAYRALWDENYPQDPIRGGIYLLRIDKETGAFDYHHRKEVMGGFEVFWHLLQINELGKRFK